MAVFPLSLRRQRFVASARWLLDSLGSVFHARVWSRRHAVAACLVPRLALPRWRALPRCVGLAGEPPAAIFFIDFNGFDVDERYVGIDGSAVGHLIIEARRHEDSPPRPCFDGREQDTAIIEGRHVAVYECSGPTLRSQRQTRHGEGAHADHVLIAWSESGIDSVASAHGHTDVNVQVLERIVGSAEWVTP